MTANPPRPILRKLLKTVVAVTVILWLTAVFLPIPTQAQTPTLTQSPVIAPTLTQTETLAQAQSPSSDAATVEVVVMSGPLDDRILGLAVDVIENATNTETELVVLQLDSVGVIGTWEKMTELASLVENPPLPVAVWIGPAPARAYGGAAQLLSVAPLRFAAPEVSIGWGFPSRAGHDEEIFAPDFPPELAEESITVGVDPIPNIVDRTYPSLRQMFQDLDGQTVSFAGTTTEIHTIRSYPGEEGTEGVTILPTVFHHADPITAMMRLPTQPVVLFFLLMMGLAVAVFEFYAIGPGIAAGVSASLLALSAYGLAILVLNWWALGVVSLVILALAVNYQHRSRLSMVMLALVILGFFGWWLTDTSPHLTPTIPGMVLTLGAVGFFFWIAMPAVARSRFSTSTVGRDFLIGLEGEVTDEVGPEGGSIQIGGGKWEASCKDPIPLGETVTVKQAVGWVLEVEPAPSR